MTGPAFLRLAGAVREQIADGRTGPAGSLDSEAELGRRFAVSRVTVRRALEVLREEGLVSSRPGSGWFAASAPLRQQLAVGTFRHAPSALADAGPVDREVLMFGFAPADGDPAQSLALAVGAQVLHVRTVRRDDGEPLDLVDEWVPAVLAGRLSRDDAARPGVWGSLRRDGVVISTVRQSVSAAVADASTGPPLSVTKGSPLLVVRRLALVDDDPVALSVHRYLAHRFTLDVEFRGWTAAGDTPHGVSTTPSTRTQEIS